MITKATPESILHIYEALGHLSDYGLMSDDMVEDLFTDCILKLGIEEDENGDIRAPFWQLCEAEGIF